MQVEYYPTDMAGTGEFYDSETASNEESYEQEAQKKMVDEGEGEDVLCRPSQNYKPAHICEELAALGYYARSMKPTKGWLSERECF